MKAPDESGLLLGRQTPVVERYAPELLYPIPRAQGRNELGLEQRPPFYGVDLWHAYELSWLDHKGKPVVFVGRFLIPADSPSMVESKSFKLYLNSLNSERFSCVDSARETMVADISTVAGAPVALELLPVDSSRLSGNSLSGDCLDTLDIEINTLEPDATLIHTKDEFASETLYSHLLRSLCPVTGQPDWATVWIRYHGRLVDRASLLRYLVAFRLHRDFHEQCVERIFTDLQDRLSPESLEVQALYTRRGGLDISPYRSSKPGGEPLPRIARQ